MTKFVLPLSDPEATLERTGGKGMSLSKLARAGLPVPPGFHVTTEAYKRFVAVNDIQPRIAKALAGIDAADTAAVDSASNAIGGFFAEGRIPAHIADAVSAAYVSLSSKAASVAVRSSATAEDLPGASFAGQQETYLNIRGAEAVLNAVRMCWASLWTARAIAYRARQGIPPDSVALAVVVQELVFADAAGIMFTANPTNGKRDEILINAAWGLGEAIVGGKVTPDTLVVDKTDGRVTGRRISRKDVMTVRIPGGTREEPVPAHMRARAVLSRAKAAELARIGVRIEGVYDRPMDIEWVLHDSRLSIVQARPITALPEPPLEWKSPYLKPLLMRGSSTDLLPDVVSPLFATLGVPIVTSEYLKMYDEVMGLRGGDVPVFEVINGYVFLCLIQKHKFWKYMMAHASTVGKLYAFGQRRADEMHARCQESVTEWSHRDLASLKAPELLAGIRELFEVSAGFLDAAVARPIPQSNFSEMLFNLFYNKLIKRTQDPDASAFLLGLESLPLRAEKSLFDLSQWAKGRSELADCLLRIPSGEIRNALQSDPVPAPFSGEFAARFAAHLAEFGHVLYDLDFMNPVPAEEPIPILSALKAYLSGQGDDPRSRQQAQEKLRRQAEQAIVNRTGPVRRKRFQKLLASAQECACKRENAIAAIGLPYPQLRRLLRELGLRLASAGAIGRSEDVCWLEAPEADDLTAALERKESLSSYAARVEIRKAGWRRARMATPPAILP